MIDSPNDSLEQYGAQLAQDLGFDPSQPEVQQGIQQVVQQARAQNPGVPDEQLKSSINQAAAGMGPDMLAGLAAKSGAQVDPTKLNQLYQAFQTRYGAQGARNAEQAYADKTNLANERERWASALAPRASADNRQVRDRELAVGKDQTVGAFEREREAAGKELITARSEEEWKQQAAELESRRKQAIEQSDPNSEVSKLTRSMVQSTLEQFPQLKSTFGDKVNSMTAADFAKISPVFKQLVDQAQKQVEFDFKKQKDEADRNMKLAKQEADLKLAQAKLDMQGQLNASRIDAANARAGEAAAQREAALNLRAGVAADKVDAATTKNEQLVNDIREGLDNVKRLRELSQQGVGGSKLSAAVRHGIQAVGGPGSSDTAEFERRANEVRLGLQGKIKGNLTNQEQAILEKAGGVSLETDENARLSALDDLETMLTNKLKVVQDDINRGKARSSELRNGGKPAAASGPVDFNSLK